MNVISLQTLIDDGIDRCIDKNICFDMLYEPDGLEEEKQIERISNRIALLEGGDGLFDENS